jgi:Glycosyl transferase family 2
MSAASSSLPSMSVIMVTPDTFQTLRHTLKHLRAQTVADQLEIVIVGPSTAALAVDAAALQPFHGYRFVEADSLRSSANARAEGIRAAAAPIIAFVEDHSFPTRGWAAALIARHREPWAAVGPAFLNGNPQTLLSWSNLLIEYGPWTDPVEAGPRDHIPPHNSSYKRDLLLAYGDRLGPLVEAETVLQWDLRNQGHELYLETAAKTRHFNISLFALYIPLRFNVGRLFGAARAREWPAGKRVFYTLASPLIPFVRFARTLPIVWRCGRRHEMWPRVLPLLFFGFVIDAAGEMAGYAVGGGSAVENTSRFEFHRDQNLRPQERHAFTES